MSLHTVKPEINIFRMTTQVQRNAMCHIKSNYSTYSYRITKGDIYTDEDTINIKGFKVQMRMGEGSWDNLSGYIARDWGKRNCPTHNTIDCPFDLSMATVEL